MSVVMQNNRVTKPRKPIPYGRIAIFITLLLGSLIMAYPLVFGLMASLSSPQAYLRSTWMPFPDQVSLSTYQNFVQYAPKALYWIGNTFIRVVWYIVAPAFIAVLCGYVFAKLKFRGRDTIFMLLLSSMMIPGIVYFISNYIMMARWPLAGGNNIVGQGGSGFVNQWPSVMILGLLNVYYIFLMRQTFYSIPRDFEEAALVDGATRFQTLWKVYLPMLIPSLMVMVIFQTVAIWNDYVWPLMAIGGNVDIQPVALGFQRLMNTPRNAAIPGTPLTIDYPWTFTVAVIATLPMILMFFALQRYFVEGSQGFAIKG